MTPSVSAETRLLVVAPHPDDETLAAGILLQRAVCARAAIRVLYLTDGENNAWPQRVWAKAWCIGEEERLRWGRLRRLEACAALRLLGVNPADAEFLAWPDQGLMTLFRSEESRAVTALETDIVSWEPSLLLAPSIADTHPDHRATGETVQMIASSLSARLPQLSIWSYQVHGARSAFEKTAVTLQASDNERERKLAAIRCHRTQMLLSQRRFLRYAARAESFQKLVATEA